MQPQGIESELLLESDLSFELRNVYENILQDYGLQYVKQEYYFQVGKITRTQGWILHITAIVSQITDLINLMVPFLAKQNVPFKIVIHEIAGEDMLNGNLGLAQIGKIVSIYPENDQDALRLAKELIPMTQYIKGPSIPTDFCLGKVVYTRYGSFNPIIKADIHGNEEKYIYDTSAQLVKDSYAIPFAFPISVEWPFSSLKEPVLPPKPKYFNRIYKVLDILKDDPRGHVFKGLYLKGIFNVKNCVLKQGFSHSASDRFGRDIRDRLVWQAELYNLLSGVVPLPTIYDLIQEEGFTLLVMEYIKAKSLYHIAQDLNPFSTRWQDLPLDTAIELVEYTIGITKIIGRMHQNGIIHRDIVPVNFLVNSKKQLYLIDIELAYSLSSKQPNPPFTLGTPGFMSPEQETLQEPNLSHDIYGLGATLLYLFTGLTPIKFNTKDTEKLSSNLDLFIGNCEISTLIASCLSHSPDIRPNCQEIFKHLEEYKTKLRSDNKQNKYIHPIQAKRLEDTITAAIKGLTQAPVVLIRDIWYSRKITAENQNSRNGMQYAKCPGLTKGLCGPLYLLARLAKAKINIDSCKSNIDRAWKSIHQEYLTDVRTLPLGLHRGAAGIAVTIAESISGGILADNDLIRGKILECLTMENPKFNLADGIAGQGLAILNCLPLLDETISATLLAEIVNRLSKIQSEQGSWTIAEGKRNSQTIAVFNFAYDDTGVIWFLLQYIMKYPSPDLRDIVLRMINDLIINKKLMDKFYHSVANRDGYDQVDGLKGVLLMLLKAYELTQDDIYQTIAENALDKFPNHIVNPNFSQQNGLAGMGELYLEAWKIFKNQTWKTKADWIANVFINTANGDTRNSCCWIMEQNSPPTADFASGVSGVIHFLARYRTPEKIGLALLN